MHKQNRQYQQLTHGERYTIQALNEKGFSLQVIANSTGRNKSTMSRELSRNRGIDGYKVDRAQRLIPKQGV